MRLLLLQLQLSVPFPQWKQIKQNVFRTDRIKMSVKSCEQFRSWRQNGTAERVELLCRDLYKWQPLIDSSPTVASRLLHLSCREGSVEHSAVEGQRSTHVSFPNM